MLPHSQSDPDQSNLEQIVRQLINSRRSIRAFLPDPVSQIELEAIFETAAYAPSNCNTQPWQTYVVSGSARDAMSQLLKQSIGTGDYAIDFPYDAKYAGVYRERQIDVGKLLYQALGVERDDKNGKHQAFMRNLDFFDAPHAAFIFMPDWCGIREAADVGMYAQNLLLTLQSHGLASCPQTILSYNADIVREQFGLSRDLKLLFGISFGYEDPSRPENKIVPTRASLSEAVHFFK
mgnify:CR=1 FL=1